MDDVMKVMESIRKFEKACVTIQRAWRSFLKSEEAYSKRQILIYRPEREERKWQAFLRKERKGLETQFQMTLRQIETR